MRVLKYFFDARAVGGYSFFCVVFIIVCFLHKADATKVLFILLFAFCHNHVREKEKKKKSILKKHEQQPRVLLPLLLQQQR